jgi:hypothetical protein
MENLPTIPTTPTTAIVVRSPHVMHNTGAAYKHLYTAVYEVRSRFDTLRLDTEDAPTETDNPSGVTTLMTLPAELKFEIFDYLLRPDDVYVHWSARAANHDVRFTHILEEWDVDALENDTIPHKQLCTQHDRSPTSSQTQLFLVSKQMRQEAMHYYLSNNTFHLMGNDSQLPYPS